MTAAGRALESRLSHPGRARATVGRCLDGAMIGPWPDG
ncbi:hypothetical protein L083_2991 [Actinoplanes sp. N902-109]|nr:hypothetical protein L083_2991 [Actinoplanes sp. N902-109]